jgi:hypothetical protein
MDAFRRIPMSEYLAIFHKETGRQITKAHSTNIAAVHEGMERGVVIKMRKYNWPILKEGYEMRRAPKPTGGSPHA